MKSDGITRLVALSATQKKAAKLAASGDQVWSLLVRAGAGNAAGGSVRTAGGCSAVYRSHRHTRITSNGTDADMTERLLAYSASDDGWCEDVCRGSVVGSVGRSEDCMVSSGSRDRLGESVSGCRYGGAPGHQAAEVRRNASTGNGERHCASFTNDHSSRSRAGRCRGRRCGRRPTSGRFGHVGSSLVVVRIPLAVVTAGYPRPSGIAQVRP